MLLVLVLLASGLFAVRCRGTDSGDGGTPSGSIKPGERISAKQAYQLALPEIRNWNGDFRITMVSTPYSDARFDRDGVAAKWMFSSGSADASSFAAFTVDNCGEGVQITEEPSSSEPTVSNCLTRQTGS